MPSKTYQTFEEFWPFYVREHGNRWNRRLHFVGTLSGMLIVLTAVLTGNWRGLLVAPIVGYGFAWIGHFVVEKNRPATFTYPLWSLRGDFKMLYLMLIRQMGIEVKKAFQKQSSNKGNMK